MRIQAELKNGYYHINLLKGGSKKGIRVKESELNVNHIKDLLRCQIKNT